MLKGVQLYAALAALALMVASLGGNVYSYFRISNLKETKTNLETARYQARENAKSHKESADKWKAAHGELMKTYNQLVKDTQKQGEDNEAAIAAARAAADDADRTLKAFMDRYANAYKNAACRAVLDMVICPEAL